jgi:hypothetical protein
VCVVVVNQDEGREQDAVCPYLPVPGCCVLAILAACNNTISRKYHVPMSYTCQVHTQENGLHKHSKALFPHKFNCIMPS